MQTLDWIWIVAYMVIVLIVGLWASRKETNEEFLIAGRSLGAFQGAMTIFSSKIGAGILLTYTALVYTYGLGAFWYFIGAVAGYVVFYMFALHIKGRADTQKYYTLSDYFTDRRGKLAGKLSGLIVFTTMFGWVAVNFTGGGKVLSTFTGIEYGAGLLAMVIVIGLYLVLGGFKAVVKTDVVQSFGILLLLVLMVYLLMQHGSRVPRSELSLLSIPTSEIINFFIAGMLFPFASAELRQRVYAIKDKPSLKKSIIMVVVLYILIGVLLLGIGLVIRELMAGLDADVALVSGLYELLPVGLAGLAAVVFFSSIMSSADTFTFTSNSALIQDLLNIDENNEKQFIDFMHVGLGVILLAGFLWALIVGDVIDTTFFFVALMMGLSLAVIASWSFARISSFAINRALAGSILAVVAMTFWGGISTSLVIYGLGGSLVGLLVGQVVGMISSRVR